MLPFAKSVCRRSYSQRLIIEAASLLRYKLFLTVPYQFASCQEVFTKSPNQRSILPQIAPVAVFLIIKAPWFKGSSGEQITTRHNIPPASDPL